MTQAMEKTGTKKPRPYRPKPSNWLQRYEELRLFLDRHRRMPDRHTPEFEGESSLAWWLKDQRRRMRLGKSDTRKRGALTAVQLSQLLMLGVMPDLNRGNPVGDPRLRRLLVRHSW